MSKMEASGVQLWGAALKSAPRGVVRDHPRIRLPRQKDVLAGADLGPRETLDGRAPAAFARSLRDRSRPVMEWMDSHVGPSVIPPDDVAP